jgi:hypothetical protein
MTPMQWNNLEVGDVVRHMTSGISYTIVHKTASVTVAIRVQEIKTPAEWQILGKLKSVGNNPL